MTAFESPQVLQARIYAALSSLDEPRAEEGAQRRNAGLI